MYDVLEIRENDASDTIDSACTAAIKMCKDMAYAYLLRCNSPQIGPVHDDASLDDELGAAALCAVPKRHVVTLLQADDISHLFDDAGKHAKRCARGCGGCIRNCC